MSRKTIEVRVFNVLCGKIECIFIQNKYFFLLINFNTDKIILYII